MVLRLRHLLRLCRDITRFAFTNRVWWFIPLMAVLGLVALGVASTQAVVPIAVYTLF